MQLQLACVAFECAHFHDTCFLEEAESKHVIAYVASVLDLTSESMHNVDQVVALIEDFIDFRAASTVLALHCVLYRTRDDLWMRLVTHSEHVLFRYDVIKA